MPVNVVLQVCIVFAISLAAEMISAILPFAMPSSVLGMVLLLGLLLCRVLKPADLKESSGFFLNNMPLFFVPVCVGVMRYADVLFQNFWAIVLISILTTPLVFFVTGQVVQRTIRWIRKKEEEKHD